MRALITVIIGLWFATYTAAEDIETLKREVYKNATVSRVEPDGIVITHAAGIVKIPFEELSEQFRQKYNYDRAAAARYRSQASKAQQALQARTAEDSRFHSAAQQLSAMQVEAEKAQRESKKRAEEALPGVTIHAIIEPFVFDPAKTTAWIRIVILAPDGTHHSEGLNWIPNMTWNLTGEKYIGVIAEAMPQNYQQGDVTAVELYKIGHTQDSQRNPLFTTHREKALTVLAQGSGD